MPKLYYNAVTCEILADYPNGRTRSIQLQQSIDKIELSYILQSDTLRAVIEALDIEHTIYEKGIE